MILSLTPAVVCCYASLNPNTLESLKSYAQTAVYENTASSPYDYADAIERHWTGERDIILIEQDMGIESDTVSSFSDCSHDWCVFEYTVSLPFEKLRYSLGCTKFSAELQRHIPFAEMRKLNRRPTWDAMDGLIWFVLHQKHGLDSHVHGSVDHLHDYGFSDTKLTIDQRGTVIYFYDPDGNLVMKREALTLDQAHHYGQEKLSRQLGVRTRWDHETDKIKDYYR